MTQFTRNTQEFANLVYGRRWLLTVLGVTALCSVISCTLMAGWVFAREERRECEHRPAEVYHIDSAGRDVPATKLDTSKPLEGAMLTRQVLERVIADGFTHTGVYELDRRNELLLWSHLPEHSNAYNVIRTWLVQHVATNASKWSSIVAQVETSFELSHAPGQWQVTWVETRVPKGRTAKPERVRRVGTFTIEVWPLNEVSSDFRANNHTGHFITTASWTEVAL